MKKILGAITLVLAGCASTGGDTPPRRTAEPPADNLIANGDRVGRIYLGMPTKALYQALGSPAQSSPYAQGKLTQFNFRQVGLVVGVDNASDTVCRIQVIADSRYATSEGVRVGSSDLEVRAKIGKPTRIFIDDVLIDGAPAHQYLYQPGLTFRLHKGLVTDIYVQLLSTRC